MELGPILGRSCKRRVQRQSSVLLHEGKLHVPCMFCGSLRFKFRLNDNPKHHLPRPPSLHRTMYQAVDDFHHVKVMQKAHALHSHSKTAVARCCLTKLNLVPWRRTKQGGRTVSLQCTTPKAKCWSEQRRVRWKFRKLSRFLKRVVRPLCTLCVKTSAPGDV